MKIVKARQIASEICLREHCKRQLQLHRNKDEIEKIIYIKRSEIAEITKEVEQRYKLPESTINIETIRSRIIRGNITGLAHQSVSPMEEVEEMVVDMCNLCASDGYPLNKCEVIALAEDYAKITGVDRKLVEFNKQRKIVTRQHPDGKYIIGNKWYYNMLKRNGEHVRRGRRKIRDIKRHNWCTYQNFEKMYSEVYGQMVLKGIAEELDHDVFFDRKGNIVDNESSQKYGRKSRFRLTKPEKLIFVHECGANTSQANNGHLGGEFKLNPTDGSCSGMISCMTDIHFTVLAFTSGTGESVMCAIILKSEKKIQDLPLSWRYGIDVTVPFSREGEEEDDDFFYNNSGEGKCMQGRPTCEFRGKVLPCFVGCSPKASITSQLLADMLAYMDNSGIFDRSDGVDPFILLDGHQSRLEHPFLSYTGSPSHRWNVSFGVSYGTHLWQVADSPYLNGSLKNALTKYKRELVRIKFQYGKSIDSTDIIPLLRKAWNVSFALVSNGRKAISSRGWGPLNNFVLDNPVLKRTNPNARLRLPSQIRQSDFQQQSTVDVFQS